MRRIFAMGIVFAFGVLINAPLLLAFSASADSLPACCRKSGKHHCMVQGTNESSPETQVSAPAEGCPFLPRFVAPSAHRELLAGPLARDAFYAALVSHPACADQAEAHCRISFDRSRQKRGPPLPSLS